MGRNMLELSSIEIIDLVRAIIFRFIIIIIFRYIIYVGGLSGIIAIWIYHLSEEQHRMGEHVLNREIERTVNKEIISIKFINSLICFNHRYRSRFRPFFVNHNLV